MNGPESEVEILLDQVRQGDAAARDKLLDRFRKPLLRMIACRMDPRLAKRCDPSDVVQEALVDAHRELSKYLEERPLQFYAWLRQFAWNRLVDLHRRHVLAQKRSVKQEEPLGRFTANSSAQLAQCLLGRESNPSAPLRREERKVRILHALAALADGDREILVLRYVEQLTNGEIAAILDVSEGAVKVRHFRALQRIRLLVEDLNEGDS